MLELIPNEDKTAIQFNFKEIFTDKQEYITAFDLDEAEMIGQGILALVQELLKKEEGNG
jgi:hypothetical protein